MSIQIIKGNLLESDVDYICHQVNCKGKMNSGIAKSIREKWPKVYADYIKYWFSFYEDENLTEKELLGHIQFCPLWDEFYSTDSHQSIINMFSQFNYGYDGCRYTSYDAFWICLNRIKNTVNKGSKIGFPYKIGCARGGANWNIIYEMIKEVLSEDFEIYIYKLED